MTDRPKDPTDRQKDSVVELLVNELTYLPTPEQRKLKTAFWTRAADNPIFDPAHANLTTVQQILVDRRLDKWWKLAGFRNWFLNREEFRERIEYLANLALDSLEEILANPEEKAVARVNASKLIMEVARKMPPKQVREIYADKRIAEMDKEQLEDFIRKNTAKLPAPVTLLDAPAAEDTVMEEEIK